MKKFFRYHRNDERKPIETVCVLSTDDGLMYSKGHAICSDKDIPCKERGRSIAVGRAMQSIVNGKDYLDGSGKICISRYMPDLTEYEKHVLGYPK